MATKPTYKPIWATTTFNLPISGLGNKVRPPAGWRAAGYGENEEPPVNYENWLKNNYYEWIDWFDAASSRAASYVVQASSGIVLNWQADATCDGTSDQVEINAAIAAVAAAGGGTVLLSEGLFAIDAKIVHDATVKVRGMGKGTLLQVPAGVSTSFNIIEVSSKDSCGVTDLAIDGNKSAHAFFHTGISVLGTSLAPLIERVHVDNCAAPVIPLAYGIGIEITGTAARARVLNCTAANCEAAGIRGVSTTSPARTFFHRNQVRDCQVGIQTWSSAGVSITENKIYNSTATGIMLGYSAVAVAPSDCQVHGNEVYTSGGSGIYAIGETCHITDNTIIDSGAHGVWAEELDRSKVCENTVRLCENYGILVDTCDDSVFDSNQIQDCSQAGTGVDAAVYIGGGARCAVRGNKFRNSTGIVSKHSIEGAAGGSGACAVYGNDCRANSSGVEIQDGAGDFASVPVWVWSGAAHVSGTAAMDYVNKI